MNSRTLSVSIVVYDLDETLLTKTFNSLHNAMTKSLNDGYLDDYSITVIDNGDSQKQISELTPTKTNYIKNETNLGFGTAHNQAIIQSPCAYHLVLNPDVEMEVTTINAFVSIAESNKDIALICPRGTNALSQNSYLAKRYPSIFDLFLRGFMPTWVRHRFSKRLISYEYRDIKNDAPTDVELVSGCCMFLQTQAVKNIGGFDESYFLYFEDFDLSIEMRKVGRIVYAPSINIIHHGGESARKGVKHILMFCQSAYRFFSKHGWKFI